MNEIRLNYQKSIINISNEVDFRDLGNIIKYVESLEETRRLDNKIIENLYNENKKL